MRELINAELRQDYPQPATTSEETTSNSPPRKRSKFLSFMKAKRQPQRSSTDSVREELDSYFSEPCIPEDGNALDYWKLKQCAMPKLANMACQYLQIPASSASVERVFSIAGKIFRPDRCNLSDDMFEQLVFIACNSK